MINKEEFACGAAASALVFLFLLSSTDLIIKEQKKEVHPVAVIVGDGNDEYYTAFRMGVDKAAEKYQADVNFITLYEAGNEEEQMEFVQREMKDGTGAIVLAPVNETGSLMRLDELSPSCPIILLGSSTVNASVAMSLAIDAYEAGTSLAEKAVAGEAADTEVWLFTEGLSYTGNAGIYDGIRSVLEENGFSYRLVEKEGEDIYRKTLEESVGAGEKKAILIAMDGKALNEIAGILEGNTSLDGREFVLYGVGSTVPILQRLDKGIIRGLIAWDSYEQGYLSIKSAVEASQGVWTRELVTQETYYIEAKDLRDPFYEKLLYPME